MHPFENRFGEELALSPSETQRIKQASDLIDAANVSDPRIAKAQDILDGLTGEPENPNE